MSHILFDGDIRRHPALRSLLWQWGVTVGDVRSGGGDGSRPTVEMCDAVVRLGAEELVPPEVSGAMPDGAEKEGAAASAAAPLLVIGESVAADQAWVTIPDPGPGGSRLRAALRSCAERARFLRGDPVSGQDRDRFRDFLGHELRTPLTAIQTALSILESDPNLGSGAERMLGIARRNLARLGDTVEWSQELGALADKAPAPDLEPVTASDLAASLPTHLDVACDRLDETGSLFTDPALLGTLAGQMERVLAYARPGCHPSFRISFDPETGQGLLSAEAGDGGGPSPQVSRTGAGHPDRDRTGWDQSEFRNLARLMISPHLLQALGARVRVSAARPGCFRLTLDVPTVPVTFPAPEPLPAV